jgi:predicted PurR-regulated permease PerM
MRGKNKMSDELFINVELKAELEAERRLTRKYRKKVEIFFSVVALLSIVMGISNSIYSYVVHKDSKNKSYDTYKRISDLDNIKNTLKELIKFVDSQQKSLTDLDDNIKNLKKEKSEIEPILSLTKDQVGALLSANDKRVNVWIERTWGFVTGLLTSVLGGVILLFLGKYRFFKSSNI